MLEIDDLWVKIDAKEVLKGIQLAIPLGETHILFGKNGSGKSSLLMTIMGFGRFQVTQGCIRFKGQDITHLRSEDPKPGPVLGLPAGGPDDLPRLGPDIEDLAYRHR